MHKSTVVPYTLDELKQMIESGFRTENANDHIIHATSIFHHLVNKYRLRFFTITDYSKLSYVYVSRQVEQVLGYPQALVSGGGLDFMLGLQHTDESESLRRIHRQMVTFFTSLSLEERLNYHYAYDVQLRKADGTYARMLCQLDCTELDDDGHLLTGMETYTDISMLHHFHRQKLIISHYDESQDNENLVYNFGIPLTKREQEIQERVDQGMVSKEIGEELHLSKNTVDTHRRRIRGKVK